jgi:uncharacterized protein YjlB
MPITPCGEGRIVPHVLRLAANGWVPNNPALPVLVYRHAFAAHGDAAATCEAMLQHNGWPPRWRNGVYAFHHYHSNAHEVLGFAAGRARLVLGGPGGEEVAVEAGDVVVLPAGTGHFRRAASRDFLVIGAYPPGQTAVDLCRGAATREMLGRIAGLPLPATDPVIGTGGPLMLLWRHTPDRSPRSLAGCT